MAKLSCNLHKSPLLMILAIALFVALVFMFKYLVPRAKKVVEALDNVINVAGNWLESGKLPLSVKQTGSTATATAPAPFGPGKGTISGSTMTWVWSGAPGAVNTGIIVASNGNATKVTWQNGVIWAKVTPQTLSTKNVVGTAGGQWGGSCTCPDGQMYQVADNNTDCRTLACHGGVSGTCIKEGGPWSGKSVTCAPATPEEAPAPPLIDFTKADPNITRTAIVHPSAPLPYKPYPTKPGCWYMYPTGCDKKNGNRHSWLQDTWGEEHAGAGDSAANCAARQDAIINMCGNKDIKTHYVPGWKAPVGHCQNTYWCGAGGTFCYDQMYTANIECAAIKFPEECAAKIVPNVGKFCKWIPGVPAPAPTPTPAPAPTSGDKPPSSWISHAGNCKAAVINTYTSMEDALNACECDDSCQALYEGKDGRWSARKSCCNVKPKPSWCTDDNNCTTGVSCNTQQGGTTYIRPGSGTPSKPINVAGYWTDSAKQSYTVKQTGSIVTATGKAPFGAGKGTITGTTISWVWSGVPNVVNKGIILASKGNATRITWQNGVVWIKGTAPTNPNLTGNWKTPLGVAKITQKPDGTLAAIGVGFAFAVTGKFNAENPLITTWNFAAYGSPMLEGILVHSGLPTVDQKTKLNQINWSNGAVWTKETAPAPSPPSSPPHSGKCVPNVPALEELFLLSHGGSAAWNVVAQKQCPGFTSKATCGPITTQCPACCMWQSA